MVRRGLGLAALVGALALALFLSRLTGPQRLQPRTAPPLSPTARNSRADVDANLPLYVGDSRRRAARAVDDIAGSDLDQALLGLGNRFLASPWRPEPPGGSPQERLVLDLTAFDQLSFVEQLLALANSRRVRSRTEAADRFSDHVRRLRYGGGRVDACARLRQASLWAVSGQRRGYLVDLTPYLPGARQRRVSLLELLQDPASAPARALASAQGCRWPAARTVRLQLAELPLQAVPAALPSLRSGDLVLLRGPTSDRVPDGIGLVEIRQGRLGALMLQPGRGVVRVVDLAALARSRSGISGMAFLRPVPNQDGKAEP